MPMETIDLKSFSSSLYSSEDICSSRKPSLWKSDNLPKCYDFDQGMKTSLNIQALSHLSDGSKVNIVATQRESSLFSSSLSELFSSKLTLSANDALYGHSVDTVASHYEEERLFDSLEELEAQIIGNLLTSDDDLLSGVTNGLNHIIQDSTGDDMDELNPFSSVVGTDLEDDNCSSSGKKNSEILDGAYNSQLRLCSALVAGEQSYDEHPSRTLVVREIKYDIEDSELRALFEQFGDIQTLDTAFKQHGFVVISYYDIRAAKNAMQTYQNRQFSYRKFDVHYSNPKDSPSKKDMNQGTLVVFLFDSSISNNELHHIFNVYGEIKEIRKNPRDQHRKLIEYYDVRAAEAAVHALNRDETIMKKLKVVPRGSADTKQSIVQQIHPKLEQKERRAYLHQNSPPLKSPTSFPGLPGISKSGNMDGVRILGVEPATCTPSLETTVPNSLPSLVRVVDNRCDVTESGSPGELTFDIQPASAFHPHSLPECHDGLANSVHHIPPELAANFNLKTQERIDNMQFCRVNSNGRFMEFNECVFKSSGNGNCPLPSHHYKWSNSYQPPGMMWPNSPSYYGGVCAAPNLQRLHGFPRSPSHMMATVLPINGQNVPSAPFWDTRHTYAEESLGNMQFSGNTEVHSVDFVSYNIFPHFRGNYVDFRILPKNLGLHFHNQRDLMFPRRNHMINSFEPHKQRARSRRNEGVSNLDDKKQYELDIDRIKKGEDNRTTLMIKNIPNKYTSKMLLATIDERHRGTYDFVYLPIDFRNKCNVGYAFINMINPGLIIPFYQVFNGKKWEKFNSEKVASLAYARIQGRAALIAHFQNSSLMNEDKRCRPILFITDGPNAGDQIPFPVGINICNKAGRVKNNTQEDNLRGSLRNMGNSKLSCDGKSLSLESD